MPTTTRWLDDDQQRSWRAFLRGTSRLMDRLERDLRGAGLSMAEYEILVELSEAPARTLRMAELADQSHQSRSRLTHTIARMERAGLVARETCNEDRRGVWARLTEEGFDRLVEIAPLHVTGVRESFVDVIESEDFVALGRAFTAVVAAHEGQPTGTHDHGCPGIG